MKIVKNFAIFSGKHLYRVSLQAIYIVAGHSIIPTQSKKMFFDVFRGCRFGCNFTKKEAPPQIFSSELCEIFKNIFFYRTSPDYCFWRKQSQTKNPDNFTYASIWAICIKCFILTKCLENPVFGVKTQLFEHKANHKSFLLFMYLNKNQSSKLNLFYLL